MWLTFGFQTYKAVSTKKLKKKKEKKEWVDKGIMLRNISCFKILVYVDYDRWCIKRSIICSSFTYMRSMVIDRQISHYTQINLYDIRLTPTPQSWNWSLNIDAPMRGSFLIAFLTWWLIIECALGHDAE